MSLQDFMDVSTDTSHDFLHFLPGPGKSFGFRDALSCFTVTVCRFARKKTGKALKQWAAERMERYKQSSLQDLKSLMQSLKKSHRFSASNYVW